MSVYGYYRTVTVRITATPGTASTQDYVFPDTELTFDGTTTTQTVTGYIVGDTDVEGDETFTLTGTLVGDAGIPYMGSTGGTVTIVDDDEPREFALSIERAVGQEQYSGAIVYVRLQPASPYPVTVAYETRDGSAKSGSDYVAASGKLTFAPGETLKWVAVAFIDDNLPEWSETFTVVLSNPTNATLSTAIGEVTIQDDDGFDGGVDLAPGAGVDLAPEDLRPRPDIVATVSLPDVSALPLDVLGLSPEVPAREATNFEGLPGAEADAGRAAVPDTATVPPEVPDAGTANLPDTATATRADTGIPSLGNPDTAGSPIDRLGGNSGCSCALGQVAPGPAAALLPLLALATVLAVRRRRS